MDRYFINPKCCSSNYTKQENKLKTVKYYTAKSTTVIIHDVLSE